MGNQILASVERKAYLHLVPHLKETCFHSREKIHEIWSPSDRLYFVEQGVVALMVVANNISLCEYALVGTEGVTDIAPFMGGCLYRNRAIAVTEVRLLELERKIVLSEFAQNSVFQRRLLLFTRVLLAQASYSLVANNLETVEVRLARLLLLISDRLARDEFKITHEFIGHLLGVRRASISIAACKLRKAGLIDYHRGRICIGDRPGLVKMGGETYSGLEREYNNLLG